MYERPPREVSRRGRTPDRPSERQSRDVSVSKKPAPQPVVTFPGSATIWIGSVPEGTSEDDLFDTMSQYGRVEGLRLVASRGFGYVRFCDERTARKIFSELTSSGLYLGNKRVRVDMCEHMPQLGHPYRPTAGSQPSNCSTLFVGNLPEDVSETEIRDFFNSRHADLEIASINLRRSGHKGFAFAHVRFLSVEDCAKASNAAGGRLRGNRLRLDWAVDKSVPPAAMGQKVETAGTTTTNPALTVTSELRGTTPRLYVGGLNESIQEEDLKTVFSQFGQVTFIRTHKDRAGNKSFGYVTFSTTDEAASAIDAIAANGVTVNGTRIRADYARPDRNNPIPAPSGGQHASAGSSLGRARSPRNAEEPRQTPVSFAVPPEYVGMRTWEQSYKSAPEFANGIST